MKIVIDEEIILEMSDLLTELSYRISKSDEYYELFILLKNFYDSIGYYTYDELEPKDVWSYSLMLMLRLQQFTSLDEDRLINRIKDVIAKIQQYLDNIHGKKNFMVVPEWPAGFVEKDQMEQETKKLTWRFGCCLAICLRAGGSKKNPLLQFLFEFLDFLNKGIYSSQGISIIEDKISQFEEKFSKISSKVGNVGYPLDIIKKEYDLTVNELKKIFKIENVTMKIQKRKENNEKEEERQFTEEELKVFPKNVKNIIVKAKNYEVTKTLGKSFVYYKKKYEHSPQFGDYILEFGISLLENEDMVKAGEILNYVCGAEDWDRMWPHALFHKARIAAILKEDEYVIEFLRRSFRAAAYFDEPAWGDDRLKEMTKKISEFHRYKGYPKFRRVIAHNYDNREDNDKFKEETF